MASGSGHYKKKVLRSKSSYEMIAGQKGAMHCVLTNEPNVNCKPFKTSPLPSVDSGKTDHPEQSSARLT
jgi:hypothetical protein